MKPLSLTQCYVGKLSRNVFTFYICLSLKYIFIKTVPLSSLPYLKCLTIYIRHYMLDLMHIKTFMSIILSIFIIFMFLLITQIILYHYLYRKVSYLIVKTFPVYNSTYTFCNLICVCLSMCVFYSFVMYIYSSGFD